MRTSIRSILAIAGLVLLLAGCSGGSVPQGTIEGVVVDGAGQAISGQGLWLLETDATALEQTEGVGWVSFNPTDFRVSSDATGHFSFEGVPSGYYMIALDAGDVSALDLKTMLLRGKQQEVAFELSESKGINVGSRTAGSD